MRWSVALPTERVTGGPELISAEAIDEMARALEAAGVDACHVTDHPYPPRSWVSAGGHYLENVERFGAEVVRAQ